MPNPILAVAGAGVGSAAIGASAQSKAASQASSAQQQAAQAGIDEQRRQFDAVRELLAPFVETGTQATQQMAALAGLSGAEAQQAQIDLVSQSPELAAAIQSGEDAILANAAATGGLRGGNTQAALAQFRPQLLNQALQNQYSRLGGLAGMGQASAAGQAAAAQNLGANVSGLMQQQGAAQAGAALARGQATSNLFGNIGGSLGSVFGASMPSGGIPQGETVFGSWGF